MPSAVGAVVQFRVKRWLAGDSREALTMRSPVLK